jgi:hypothetical protein
MELFVIISDKSKLPIAIFDDYIKAKQYLHAMPSEHLYIFQYKLNDISNGKKVADSYYIHGIF